MSQDGTNSPVSQSQGDEAASGSRTSLKRKLEEEELASKNVPLVEEGEGEEVTKRLKTNEGFASVVAKHYNELQEKGVEARSESRIFYMRNFNNWTKSMLINEAMQRFRDKRVNDLVILDLCCGKGGDILKWLKSNMANHIVFADIASTSVEQCKERYDKVVNNQGQQNQYGRGGRNRNEKLFSAEFVTADCTKERLRDKYKDPDTKFDLISCQFSFHYCFESFSQAKMMLQNITENLRVGGLFIGTIPNACRIVRLLRNAGGKEFGNSVFKVEFDCDEPFPLFGAKYYFQLEEVVNCPEFLVHFGTLEKLARLYGLRLLFKYTFDDFFQQKQNDGHYLLERMQALQTFPLDHSSNNAAIQNSKEYSHAQKFYDEQKYSRYQFRFGTLSASEWEAVTLYLVFAFEKIK